MALSQALLARGLSQHLQLPLLHDQQHLFLERRDLLVQVHQARLCQVGQQVDRRQEVLLVLFLEGQQEVPLVLVPVGLCHLLQQLALMVVRDLVLLLQHQQLALMVVRDLVLLLQHQQLAGPLVGLCPVALCLQHLQQVDPMVDLYLQHLQLAALMVALLRSVALLVALFRLEQLFLR